jgi:hypothetical protein
MARLAGFTGAIVGARGPSQVDGWIEAATLKLDDADMREIGAAIRAPARGLWSRAPYHQTAAWPDRAGIAAGNRPSSQRRIASAALRQAGSSIMT